MRLLGVADLDFRPYSVRRGGASFDFGNWENLDRTLFRGRWRGLKTARIYVQMARAVSVNVALPPAASKRCNALASLLPHLHLV